MTPRRLLSLWRERWGKEPDAEERPYLDGALADWGRRFAQLRFWAWPGMAGGAFVLGALLFVLLASIRFPLDSQVFFSVPLLVAAMIVTRWGGTVTTLVIVALALLASARYLSWRLFETLDPELGWEFALGFGLWAAELLWFASTLAGKARWLWPLRREPVALPDESYGWPAVDLLLLCEGQAEDAIRAAAGARSLPEWPKKKLRLFLLDGAERPEVRQLAEAQGAVYLVQPGRAEAVNAALAQGKGELVAIVECSRMPERSFLTACAGWFVEERRFAMLQTHDHFLAPPASARVRRMVEAPHAYQSFALIRREALEKSGGVQAAPAAEGAHTALALQALGYGVAYAGIAAGEDDMASGEETAASGGPEPFRIDFPFGRTVLWKERVVELHRALRFYEPVPRIVFLLAPALGLLGDARLIQASFTLYFAYAVPHLLHVHISQARMRGHGRLPFWTELRETALSWYMVALTGINLIPVLAGRARKAFADPEPVGREPFDWAAALPYLIAFGINLAGIGLGLVGLLRQRYMEPDFAVLFLLWCLYNTLLLMSMLAVALEARQVRQHTRQKRRLPVMVKLASRRTVSGFTRNFPETQLTLDLNAAYDAADDEEVHLSLFEGDREHDFSARIVARRPGVLTLRIERTALPRFRAFAAAAFARGADWPEWLPPRGADHPLPQWISRPALAAFLYILDWTDKFARLLNFSSLPGWIRKWKKT
jgi:cellulose synthase (UDP-forming)